MTTVTRAKRLTYLLHRWMGVGACVLMAIWFVSGMVMLFIGYPKLTPWERLGALPVLQEKACCVPLDSVLAELEPSADVQEIVLTSIRNHPYYRLRTAAGNFIVVDAVDGKPAVPAHAQTAMAAAQTFVPNADAHYVGTIQEDRWTHSRALNPHRPLHMVQMDDPAHTLLYISSSTGEVVMDAPRAQRAWNYVGAWLHWLYFLRDRPVDPVWSWIVIVLSTFGTLIAITGTLAGIWRWRFSGQYKSGARSPYREPYLRWHHIIGLSFAAFLFTWIFSGLMSMNPLGIFDAKGARPDLNAWHHGSAVKNRMMLEAPQAVTLLKNTGFQPVEIMWRILDGRPYLQARNAAASTRLIMQEDGVFTVRTQWDDATLLRAASRLLPVPVQSSERLEQYDDYYYGRQPEAMMGASERRLPVLRVQFADEYATWSYLDPYTGDVALSMDRSQRTGRWLFNFLHSWDMSAMLNAGAWRDAVLIVLSLGGLAIAITGIVIGWHRLRIWLNRIRKRIS